MTTRGGGTSAHADTTADATLPCPTCKGRGRVLDGKAFGARMQKRRVDARLTLREVAARMELSISYVSDLEHGRKKWRGGLIAAYVDAVERLTV